MELLPMMGKEWQANRQGLINRKLQKRNG